MILSWDKCTPRYELCSTCQEFWNRYYGNITEQLRKWRTQLKLCVLAKHSIPKSSTQPQPSKTEYSLDYIDPAQNIWCIFARCGSNAEKLIDGEGGNPRRTEPFTKRPFRMFSPCWVSHVESHWDHEHFSKKIAHFALYFRSRIPGMRL